MVQVVEGLKGVWAGEILQEEEEFRSSQEKGWVFEGNGESVLLEGEDSLWDDLEKLKFLEELREEGREGFGEKVLDGGWECGGWLELWVWVG